MNAIDYREIARKKAMAEAVDLTLPSGMVIKARRPGMEQLAMWGVLPLGLADELDRDGDELPMLSTKQVHELMRLSKDVLMFAFLSPRLALNPKGDNEIHPLDVPDEDTRFVLDWAMRRKEADGLRRFRRESAVRDAGDHGEGVRAEAIGDAGDHGSGAGHDGGPGSGDVPRHHTTPTPRNRG